MDKFDEFDKKLSEYKQKHLPLKLRKDKSSDAGIFVVAELLAGIGIGGFLGYQLDQYLNTKMLFLLILVVIGLISAFYNIYNKYKG